ncbi:hypothetical protein [Kallotenue papyrolyticum]|uniref:hypothetical protein n=1 Tax=Kallotenue papyrolyticum TaxID=1325125 RepID=UPI0012680C21|nr:hypothetical protein [Kallotenue papyrolyticum]
MQIPFETNTSVYPDHIVQQMHYSATGNYSSPTTAVNGVAGNAIDAKTPEQMRDDASVLPRISKAKRPAPARHESYGVSMTSISSGVEARSQKQYQSRAAERTKPPQRSGSPQDGSLKRSKATYAAE